MTNLCLIILLLLHTPALAKKSEDTTHENSISNKAKNDNHNKATKLEDEQKILSEIFDDLTHDIHLELNKTQRQYDENVRRKRLQVQLRSEHGQKSPLALMMGAMAAKSEAEQPAEIPVEKPVEKSVDKPDEKPSENPVEKPVEKPRSRETSQFLETPKPVEKPRSGEMSQFLETPKLSNMHDMSEPLEMMESAPTEEFRSAPLIKIKSRIIARPPDSIPEPSSSLRSLGLPRHNPKLAAHITHTPHGEHGTFPQQYHQPPSQDIGSSPYDKYTTPAPHVSSLAPIYHSTPPPHPGYFSTYGPPIGSPPLPYHPALVSTPGPIHIPYHPTPHG